MSNTDLDRLATMELTKNGDKTVDDSTVVARTTFELAGGKQSISLFYKELVEEDA